VGVKTVLNDDPMLTARGVSPARPMTRVVLDAGLDIPHTSALVTTAREHPLLVLASCDTFRHDAARVHALEKLGVRVEPVNMTGRHFPLEKTLRWMGEQTRWTHLLVEPGPGLAKGFRNFADRVWMFRSPKVLNDAHAPRAAGIFFPVTASLNVDGDDLSEHLNREGEAYFANVPSADFVMAEGSVRADKNVYPTE